MAMASLCTHRVPPRLDFWLTFPFRGHERTPWISKLKEIGTRCKQGPFLTIPALPMVREGMMQLDT